MGYIDRGTGRLKRELGQVRRRLVELVGERRLGLGVLEGNPEARQVLSQLEQLVSVAQLRGVAELLTIEPAAVAIVGPVNVGKSTLLNVLAGREVAEVAATPGTTQTTRRHEALGFAMVDTPGADEHAGDQRRELALDAARQASLTILLLDATRGITTSEREIYDRVVEALIERAGRSEDPPPTARDLVTRRTLIVVVNKVDSLPRGELDGVLERMARDLGLPPGKLLAISAHRRRGLDELSRAMIEGAPSMAEALAEAMPAYAETMASELIFRHAAAAATVALTPMPVSHVLPLTALQLALVVRLAHIYGHQMDWRRSREVLPTLAAGMGWRELFRQVVKLVPVTGWALNGGIAYAGTYATGRTAQHLLRTGDRPSSEQLIRWRKEARAHHRAEASRVD